MHGVQKPELFRHQEQENDYGTAGDEEILSPLPEAPSAQRNQVE
jgi:hypothetical protein